MTVEVKYGFGENVESVELIENVSYVQVRAFRSNRHIYYCVENSSYSRNPGRCLCDFADVIPALDFQDVVNSCYKNGVNMLSFKVSGNQFSYTTEEREEELNEERV